MSYLLHHAASLAKMAGKNLHGSFEILWWNSNPAWLHQVIWYLLIKPLGQPFSLSLYHVHSYYSPFYSPWAVESVLYSFLAIINDTKSFLLVFTLAFLPDDSFFIFIADKCEPWWPRTLMASQPLTAFITSHWPFLGGRLGITYHQRQNQGIIKPFSIKVHKYAGADWCRLLVLPGAMF